MTRPALYVAMRRHRRADGSEFLLGTFDAAVAIAAGATVRLLLDDDGRSHVLQLVQPVKPWEPTKRERQALAVANAPRGVLRPEPQAHQLEEESW